MNGKQDIKQILGHNEFPNSNKTCPNFDVQKWCKRINYYERHNKYY